jgi:hypothetical protein
MTGYSGVRCTQVGYLAGAAFIEGLVNPALAGVLTVLVAAEGRFVIPGPRQDYC